jgi:hypothetical protein
MASRLHDAEEYIRVSIHSRNGSSSHLLNAQTTITYDFHFVFIFLVSSFHYFSSFTRNQNQQINTKSFKMQYSTLFLAALSATGSLAAPMKRQSADLSIIVTLATQEIASTLSFDASALPQELDAIATGPFDTFTLSVGADVDPQTLRCQAIDDSGNPLVATRGENVDVTFSDGGKDEWTFPETSIVSKVICDPAFQQADKSDNTVVVRLSGPGELQTQTTFTGAEREAMPPIGSSGPYDTIEIVVGSVVVDQDIRCKVLDNAGNQIVAVRNTNTDTTFSDAGKGAWKFFEATQVSEIICDPAAVAMPL